MRKLVMMTMVNVMTKTQGLILVARNTLSPQSTGKAICVDESWSDRSGDKCSDYANEKYCTIIGEYGSEWLPEYGSFEDYAHHGYDASYCPQCGCKIVPTCAAPPQLRVWKNAFFSNPAIELFEASSLQKCLETCLPRKDCLIFEYRHVDRICAIKNRITTIKDVIQELKISNGTDSGMRCSYNPPNEPDIPPSEIFPAKLPAPKCTSEHQMKIWEDAEFVSETIVEARDIDSLVMCMDICIAYSNCNVINYQRYEKTCWLKKNTGTYNMHRPGMASAIRCTYQPALLPPIWSYSFHPNEQPVGHLRPSSGYQHPALEADCTSSRQMAIWAHVDMNSSDYRTVPRTSVIETCADLCLTDYRCQAFVWEEKAKLCRLKSRPTTFTVNAPKYYSGFRCSFSMPIVLPKNPDHFYPEKFFLQQNDCYHSTDQQIEYWPDVTIEGKDSPISANAKTLDDCFGLCLRQPVTFCTAVVWNSIERKCSIKISITSYIMSTAGKFSGTRCSIRQNIPPPVYSQYRFPANRYVDSPKWSNWTTCSRSCGGGTQVRTHLCNSETCPGAIARPCNTLPCTNAIDEYNLYSLGYAMVDAVKTANSIELKCHDPFQMYVWNDAEFVKQEIITINVITSFKMCMDVCLATVPCNAITFRRKDQRCVLKSGTRVYKINKPGYVSALRCSYDPKRPPPTPADSLYPRHGKLFSLSCNTLLTQLSCENAIFCHVFVIFHHYFVYALILLLVIL